MKIDKPGGGTPTERLLSTLCEKTFLKLWSWANPRKDDGKELCDLLAIFDNHIFIFFDRESKALRDSRKDIGVAWPRWKKEAIDKQIKTVKGADRYIRDGRPIFLDSRLEQPFPGLIPERPIIHRVIVAHGASEACKLSSEDNVYGSLAIVYGNLLTDAPPPFLVKLERRDPIHIFDSVNLGVALRELDTFADFLSYISEKEEAIAKYESLAYCGEEDLVAHYFQNHDVDAQKYPSLNALMIEEGMWKGFYSKGYPERRRAENRDSYLWDELIQRTYQNALEGTTSGVSLWRGKDALHEMAREPRLARRALAGRMLESIRRFPATDSGIVRNVVYIPSFSDQRKMYLFLQLRCHTGSFEDCRRLRQHMIKVACGVVKN